MITAIEGIITQTRYVVGDIYLLQTAIDERITYTLQTMRNRDCFQFAASHESIVADVLQTIVERDALQMITV